MRRYRRTRRHFRFLRSSCPPPIRRNPFRLLQCSLNHSFTTGKYPKRTRVNHLFCPAFPSLFVTGKCYATQNSIGGTSPLVISFGSVSRCTSSSVTPGRISL